MKNLLGYANDLIGATQSGNVVWEYMDDAPCLTASFSGKNFILCKTETDSGKSIISLNYLSESGELLGDFQKWEQGDDKYYELDKLVEVASSHQVLKKAC